VEINPPSSAKTPL